jgi:translocation and assembly module TamA
MRLAHLPKNVLLGLVVACIGSAFLGIGSTALAQAALGNSVETGLRIAMQRGESDSWLQSPSSEQRQEAGILFLRSEGYYGASIEEASAQGPTTPGSDGGFVVTLMDGAGIYLVRSGPQFRIVAARVIIEGNRTNALNDLEESVAKLAVAVQNEPARAIKVLELRGQILATARSAGFVLAVDQEADVLVDHQDETMSIVYKMVPGPLITATNVQVNGANLTPQAWVVRAAAIGTGEVAKGERLKETSDRFQQTGAYSKVDVTLASPQTLNADTGVADVIISLEERRKRTWSAGAVWSTTDGLGLDATTSLFHLMSRADTLTFDMQLGTLGSSLGTSWRFPSLSAPSRDLFLEAKAGQETTDAYERFLAHVGGTYVIPRGDTVSLTYGIGLDITRTRVPIQKRAILSANEIDGADVTALIRYERDRSDDVINPKRGWRMQSEVQPAVFVGNGQTIPYGRLIVAGSIYQPLPALKDGVFAARLKGGYLFSSSSELPFDRRFFAGGGGSVRGYAYQSIGPRDANDNPLGGISVLEGSVEARWSIQGPYGMAIFADIARVGSTDSGDEAETKAGVGVGLRFNLGQAPLRIDVAFPVSKRNGDPSAQIYLSAGQSF